jgi:[ribosomal protein S5]-alanine N-acetyltransferase
VLMQTINEIRNNEMFPEIKTNRLRLRQIVESDHSKIFEGLSNPDVVRHYGVSYQSLEEAKAQMEWFSYLEKTKTGIWWAVCSRDDNEFYGAGGINNVDEAEKKAELGYWLLPKFWSQGILSESLPHIIDYAFNALGLDRVEGVVEDENLICKKRISRLGFVHMESLDHHEFKNGRFINLKVYVFHKNMICEI